MTTRTNNLITARIFQVGFCLAIGVTIGSGNYLVAGTIFVAGIIVEVLNSRK